MSMADRIEVSLKNALDPIHVELVNESHQHSVPKNSETHWNLIIVSEAFAGKRLVGRQRAVYKALHVEMNDGIHALTMKTLTPDEWIAAGGDVSNASPPCMGGSKRNL
ncbi:MAG: BolA family protein [Myxococcota bacterium]